MVVEETYKINRAVPTGEGNRDGDDDLRVDRIGGVVESRTTGETIRIDPLPDVMMTILQDGGLKPHVAANDGLELE